MYKEELCCNNKNIVQEVFRFYFLDCREVKIFVDYCKECEYIHSIKEY